MQIQWFNSVTQDLSAVQADLFLTPITISHFMWQLATFCEGLSRTDFMQSGLSNKKSTQ